MQHHYPYRQRFDGAQYQPQVMQPVPGMGHVAVGEVSPGVVAWSALSTVSMAASAYHGYKRNDSIGWALWWGLCGSLFPVITPVVAVAQGYGERAR